MTATLSPAKTHLHVYLHASVDPGDEAILRDQVLSMLGAGIGLGVVGTLDGRSSYVPMSLNIPLGVSRSVREALDAVLADIRDREAIDALHRAVYIFIHTVTGTRLRLAIKHFLPGTAETMIGNHTLSSR